MLSVGKPLHAETQRHLRRCTGATDDWIKDLDLLIRGLINEGLWSKLRCICVVAPTSADSLLDLKNNYDSSLVGSPTFTANRGFLTSGTTNIINSGFSWPSIFAGTDVWWYRKASCSVYIRNAQSGPNKSFTGARFIFSNVFNLYDDMYLNDNGSTSLKVDIGCFATTTLTVAGGGFRAGTFDPAAGTEVAAGDESTVSVSTSAASANLGGPTMYIGCFNNNETGSLTQAAANEYSHWSFGFAMTQTDLLNYNILIKEYMTRRGAAV